MKNYKLLFLLLLLFSKSFAQKSVNDYKYVIVPEQFRFQQEPNQYRLNQLTKFLLKKYGFDAYIEKEALPLDLRNNICLALKADIDIKGTFKTKATIKLLDCYNNVIYVSGEGSSKVKEFNKTYNLAIRDASKSLEVLDYKFVEKDSAEIFKVKVSKDKNRMVEAKNEIVKETNELQQSTLQSSKEVSLEVTESSLDALPITNGYKLINSLSKQVEYIMYASEIENTFIIKDKSGIIFKKDNGWVRQYVDKQRTMLEFLDIRF